MNEAEMVAFRKDVVISELLERLSVAQRDLTLAESRAAMWQDRAEQLGWEEPKDE